MDEQLREERALRTQRFLIRSTGGHLGTHGIFRGACMPLRVGHPVNDTHCSISRADKGSFIHCHVASKRV